MRFKIFKLIAGGAGNIGRILIEKIPHSSRGGGRGAMEGPSKLRNVPVTTSLFTNNAQEYSKAYPGNVLGT